MGLTIPIANVIYILFYILFDKRRVDSFKCNLKGIYVVTVYLMIMAFFYITFMFLKVLVLG